jgi:hypothetical protein
MSPPVSRSIVAAAQHGVAARHVREALNALGQSVRTLREYGPMPHLMLPRTSTSSWS